MKLCYKDMFCALFYLCFLISKMKFPKLFKSPCKNSSIFNSMTALESWCKCSWAAAAHFWCQTCRQSCASCTCESLLLAALRWVCCHLEQAGCLPRSWSCLVPWLFWIQSCIFWDGWCRVSAWPCLGQTPAACLVTEKHEGVCLPLHTYG